MKRPYDTYNIKKRLMRFAAGLALALLSCAPTYSQTLQNSVTIAVFDGYRTIQSNGIPNHATGQFPNNRNPNAITAQRHTYRVPANPKRATTTTPLGLWPFGVALNGVPFDPGAAEFWNRDRNSGWQYAALTGYVDLGMDTNNAHVQPGGAYHYHGVPVGLIEHLRESQPAGMLLIGYAADGFPIYAPEGYSDPNNPSSPLRTMRSSYRLKRGARVGGPGGPHTGEFLQDFEYVSGLGDLDECNGRFGVTPEYPGGIYHYFVTYDFPFIPRLFRGTPDLSFIRRGPPGGPTGNRPRPGARDGFRPPLPPRGAPPSGGRRPPPR